MKITSDENVNQAVEQMVQAIRNTDAYLEYQKQLARVKEQPELKRQIDEFRTRNFELQTSKDTNFDKLDQFTRENEAFRENPLVSDFLAAELAFCRMMQEIGLYVTDQMHFECAKGKSRRDDFANVWIEMRITWIRKDRTHEGSNFGRCRIGRYLKSGICSDRGISGVHRSVYMLRLWLSYFHRTGGLCRRGT